MAMKKKTTIANLILLSVAFVWGATFVLVEHAIAFFPPFLFNSIRFLLAAITLWLIIIIFFSNQIKQINMKMIGAGVILGIWLFGGFMSQTIGLLYTTSGKAGFITGLSVVLVPIFSYFLLKLKLKKNAVIGISISTVGLYLLTFGDIAGVNIGDLFVFFCAIFFALQIVFTGKYAPHYATLVLATVQISTVAVFCIIGAIMNGEWAVLRENPHFLFEPAVLWGIIICALLATSFAYVAQTELQKFSTPTQVALIFATEPVFAALADFLWNDRWLTTISLLGCLFILGGMILSELQWGGKKKYKNVFTNQESKGV